MSMEQNGNQNMASQFCRNGCGFYAAQAFDGLCSKCYKDLKQLKQNDSPVSAIQSASGTPPMGLSSICLAASDSDVTVDAVSAVLSKASLCEMNVNASSNSNNDKVTDKLPVAGCSMLETASPTVTSMKAASSDDVGGSGGSTGGDSESEGEKGKKPKKNRCMECRKKVGLTGFVCHCGKLLCSLHRYSDTHECSFDFKEKAQQEIRKNNPVVKGEKIQRI
ncbi:unnamed protein product [Candidula unifasciata]|uniref:Uncharacterized protein n=1 Tax=Candidula unifasciata TaxID=100452 RepID=A0A8S3ZI02_9EUPU|nr:unnamed protein product [Candidula unifasciata]